jgi:hypothetical protein
MGGEGSQWVARVRNSWQGLAMGSQSMAGDLNGWWDLKTNGRDLYRLCRVSNRWWELRTGMGAHNEWRGARNQR